MQKLGYLGGEKLGWSVIFPPWQEKASTLPGHEYTYSLCFLGGGEKLGRPSFSPPPKKQMLHVYSWQGKVVCVFPQMINHMHNSFSPPDNLLHEVDV